MLLPLTFMRMIRIKRAMQGYFAGLFAYRPELLPFAASKLWKPLSEFRYARTFGIEYRDTNREIEPCEDAPVVPRLLAKPPD
jgi:hypothetical protein